MTQAQKFAAEIRAKYADIPIRNTLQDLALLRQVKPYAEIALHRLARAVTAAGVTGMLAHLRPGMHAYQAEASFAFAFTSTTRRPAIAAARPGQPKNELAGISREVMARELVRIGMIERPEEIAKYYFHGSGHYIGLYTHDVGDDNAPLEENMMFTLEPGLYFDELQLGIRIEDTLLVTRDGCEVLTASIPKTVEEIEAFMQARSASGCCALP